MEKVLFIPILLLVLYSCSPDEETEAPTNTVQTITPEPEAETPEPVVVQYTLTLTTSDGGSVTEGGTFDEGIEVTVTATPNEGYQFIGWQDFDSDESSITITINSNQEYEALFDYEYNQFNFNEPPFGGTIFITGDIITSSNPSLFSEIEYKGTGQRQMYDRRNGGAWINIEPYLFDTSFSDDLKTEIQINPEFTLDEATVEANKYAFLIGQLPTALRKDVQTMWIHKGEEAYGGGNYNILVHTWL